MLNVRFLKEAEIDLDEAYVWYEVQQQNLGELFFKEVFASINYVIKNPSAFQQLKKN